MYSSLSQLVRLLVQVMEDDKLIEYIREYNELFDESHRRYIDTVWKAQVWSKIGKKLGQNPKRCKSRWESLRAQYRKYVRILQKTKGRASNPHTKFKYAKEMEFLRPHLKNRRRASSAFCDDESNEFNPDCLSDVEPNTETESKLEETPFSETPTPSQISCKRSCSKNLSDSIEHRGANSLMMKSVWDHEERSEDEIDHFFQAMKGSFRKFSPLEQLQAKQQIFNIITNIEAKRCEKYYCCKSLQPQNPLPSNSQQSPSQPLKITSSRSFSVNTSGPPSISSED